MEHISGLVRTMLASAGLTASGAARRAGVSGSTLHRIVNDQVDPSFGTLREVAIACGRDLALTATHLSDPLAAAAARSLLEAGYEPPDNPEVTRWQERLPRLAGNGHPLQLVKTAASASAPLHRADAALYTGAVPLARLASAGEASRGRWAISGPAGLSLPPPGDTAPTVTILWCERADAVEQYLVGSGLRATHRVDKATVAITKAEPELFAGSFTSGIVRYAAPIQIVLDCISQAGRVADDAIELVSSW